jgi:hypothetical protein
VSRCRKVPYRTKLDAKIALSRTYLSQKSKREERRIYWCQEHKAYHLTSKK